MCFWGEQKVWKRAKSKESHYKPEGMVVSFLATAFSATLIPQKIPRPSPGWLSKISLAPRGQSQLIPSPRTIRLILQMASGFAPVVSFVNFSRYPGFILAILSILKFVIPKYNPNRLGVVMT